jgi:hypothetical protein
MVINWRVRCLEIGSRARGRFTETLKGMRHWGSYGWKVRRLQVGRLDAEGLEVEPEENFGG